MENPLVVVIVIVGEFLLLGLVIWIVARRFEQRARLRAELHMKLIERFTSVSELEGFLQTEAGKTLLASYSAHPRAPLSRIAVTAQIGVVLVVLSLGVFAMAAFVGGNAPLAASLLIGALGAGLLAAAIVGRRLLKSWGVDGGPTRA